MDLTEYSRYDGVSLAELIRSGQVTSKQLASLLLEAVEKVNPKINSIIQTYPEIVDSLNNSDASEGSFSGVPFLIKDLGPPERGRLQERGSRLTKGLVSEGDSYLTTRFRDAGLTLMGRTTAPEFGTSSTTDSSLMGATRNPWNPDIMPGGSSGGAAAAVAAGVLPVASASDGGGSIRIPASACGLVGLKPSRGRITLGPDRDEAWGGLATSFVVSKTVRDTAVMLDAVSQPMLGDPFTIVQPARPYSTELDVPVERLRIAWTVASWRPDAHVDSEVRQLVERIAGELEKIGHDVREDSPGYDYETYLFAFSNITSFGFDVSLDNLGKLMNRPVNEDTIEPVNLAQYHYAKSLTSRDMVATHDILNKFRRTFGEFFQHYDLLVTPTLSLPPGPIGKYSTQRNDLDFVEYIRMTDELNMHMPAANITGLPAISLPLGQSNSGLPLGVQFVSRFGNESLLIRLSSALEKLVPWKDRVPPIHVSN
jgi:amidase